MAAACVEACGLLAAGRAYRRCGFFDCRTRSLMEAARSDRGVVAAPHAAAAETGRAILAEGGNAYEATDVPRVPRSMAEAIAALRDSTLAREAFGDDVIAHYLNMAEVEQRAYDMAVTDWERRRYFERG